MAISVSLFGGYRPKRFSFTDPLAATTMYCYASCVITTDRHRLLQNHEVDSHFRSLYNHTHVLHNHMGYCACTNAYRNLIIMHLHFPNLYKSCSLQNENHISNLHQCLDTLRNKKYMYRTSASFLLSKSLVEVEKWSFISQRHDNTW